MQPALNARRFLLSACLFACTPCFAAGPVFPAPAGESAEYWRASGKAHLARVKQQEVRDKARNVILFLGDGMGISTVAAARILDGQMSKGSAGEEHQLSFERFPYVGLAKTYTTDAQVSDSAGTMSAIMTGIKTRSGVISVTQAVKRGDCASGKGREAVTLLEQAEQMGLATGIVSTASLTHATPAATYAHAVDRSWESDARMPAAERQAGCRDIARQLLEFSHGDGIEVALGGGRRFFLPKGEEGGTRLDGRDLTSEWLKRFRPARLVQTRSQLQEVNTSQVRYLLGLFSDSHMQFDGFRKESPQPSLAEMTRTAIQMLSRNPRGYFLMVEAGRIDHGHHAGNAWLALQDTRALSAAVREAVQMTAEDDTLILVTADHSHVFTLAGYPMRGNHILGKVRTAPDQYAKDQNGLPYTTLGYANGPGYRPGGRPDLTSLDTTTSVYLQEATLPMSYESHAGEDVAVYARGPGAHWTRGVMEQHVLYHIMHEALLAHRQK